jgi:hypothetical protein
MMFLLMTFQTLLSCKVWLRQYNKLVSECEMLKTDQKGSNCEYFLKILKKKKNWVSKKITLFLLS